MAIENGFDLSGYIPADQDLKDNLRKYISSAYSSDNYGRKLDSRTWNSMTVHIREEGNTLHFHAQSPFKNIPVTGFIERNGNGHNHENGSSEPEM